MARGLLTTGLLAAAIVSSVAGAAELPAGFRLEPVLGGLTDPSGMAFTPDGRILIAERTTGALRQVRGGELQAAPLCAVAVEPTGEAGLLGVAVHPGFLANGFVYLYYTDASTQKNRVARFAISGNTCSVPTVLLPDLGAGAGFLRNGGGIGFGADGKLYVATGDVEDQANGQDDLVLEGKVLRMNDDGTVPADNPTPGSLVFAKGLRDGQGLAFHANGTVYVTDRGADASSDHDELNAVPAGANLGWAIETGGGGVLDPPMQAWLPTVGVRGAASYAGDLFPDADADGTDSDFDGYGLDAYPGRARFDDDGNGTCVGSNNSGAVCTSNGNCPSRPSEVAFCELRDEPDEYCPGGVPAAGSDDVCGDTGAAGVDEPDESYLDSVFLTAGNKIYREVPADAGVDQLASDSVFINSLALPDCPRNWTAVAAGPDGLLYALAANGGGANAGKLYRFVYDKTPGPREVSRPGSPFALRMAKGGTPGQYVVSWEDLRDDAKQPRDNGSSPLLPVREYTVWKGTFGDWTSHAPMAGQQAIEGAPVNDALRTSTISVPAGESSYFLVSARSGNLEGTLGQAAGGERPGAAVGDLCQAIGYHQSPSYSLFACGHDFAVLDEFGEVRSLYDFRGRVVWLDLSAIWCAPCNAQANVMAGVDKAYKDRDVQLLTVLVDDAVNSASSPPGRPEPPECRNWSDRPDPNQDHLFPCWVDPDYATAWPLYDKHSALPTNVILDTGLRVVYTAAGYNETAIRNTLNQLVGSADSCLH